MVKTATSPMTCAMCKTTIHAGQSIVRTRQGNWAHLSVCVKGKGVTR
jgi:hypothetical protein